MSAMGPFAKLLWTYANLSLLILMRDGLLASMVGLSNLLS